MPNKRSLYRACSFAALGVSVSLAAEVMLPSGPTAQERSAAEREQELARAASVYEHALELELKTASPADLKQAAQLYEQAAQLGFAPARARLSYLYRTGTGVPRDPGLAFRWLSLAAETDVEAKFQLALLHLEGVGTARDAAEARRWLARAANAGHQEAQLVLGLLLLHGVGGPRNDEAAFQWMDRARRGRDPDLAMRAAKTRNELADSIRSKGQQPTLSIEAILVVAFAALAFSDSGAPYDSNKYDAGRQSERIQCERQCMNQAYGQTRTAPGLAGAYERCRAGC